MFASTVATRHFCKTYKCVLVHNDIPNGVCSCRKYEIVRSAKFSDGWVYDVQTCRSVSPLAIHIHSPSTSGNPFDSLLTRSEEEESDADAESPADEAHSDDTNRGRKRTRVRSNKQTLL